VTGMPAEVLMAYRYHQLFGVWKKKNTMCLQSTDKFSLTFSTLSQVVLLSLVRYIACQFGLLVMGNINTLEY